MIKKFLLFFAVIFISDMLAAQNVIGLPEITNYSKSVYGAGAQNWDIKQDSSGVLYFGNNEGLLTFDGAYWRLYRLPNNTVVRSVEISGRKIYVGGQNEIGCFAPDKTGRLAYTSLKQLLPAADRSFQDVWNIVSYEQNIYFRTSTKIMELKGHAFSVFPDTDWRFLGSSGQKLLAQTNENRVFEFRNESWAPYVAKGVLPNDYLITSIVPYGKDTSIVTTLKNGLFFLSGNKLTRFDSEALNNISRKNIYTAAIIDGDHLLLATSLGGCFIVDLKGNLIQSFSTLEGLQNNNVRHVFLDRNKNLWFGLDNGIAFIAYGNAIKQVNPDRQSEAAGYAAIIHDNSLYIGTTNGLYSVALDQRRNISLVKGSFKLVENSQGQVWNLSEVNNELLMAHHEGSFIIKNNRAVDFDHSSGFWNFFLINNHSVPMMLAGNYQGINFYAYDGGRLVNRHVNIHFESARIVAIDNDDIWVAHPYKGVFRINLATPTKPVVRDYAVNKGLFSVNHYYVYKVKNKIISPTESDIYEYDASNDRFIRSGFFSNVFKGIPVNYLKEDSDGNVWFVSEKNLGVVDFSGPEPKVIYIPELKGKIVSGFEFIYPVDKNNVFIGGEKGFYCINYEQYKKNSYAINVFIRNVKALNETDSIIFGGYDYAGVRTPDLNYKWNSLHFEYSSTLYGQQSNLEYCYFLKGFDKNWSAWSRKTEKDYTNLPYGTYTFIVKARNNLGNESAPVSYRFTILPPWYESLWAYIFYIIITLWFFYWLSKRQRRKLIDQQQVHKEEQKRLQYLYELEIDRNEKEIINLKNQNLETEINFKNKELATATMNLVQKGELLGKIREELTRLLKHSGSDSSAEQFKRVIKMMSDEEKFEQAWEQFSLHFDRVHGDFLLLLKTKYPNITPSELKLCAYLRMNLSTKEVAQLMNISVRGVEVSRYRLRKKLQIPSEVNLFDYLIEAVKDGNQNSINAYSTAEEDMKH